MPMNPKYEDCRMINMVGRLDKDENDKRIITIELKDDTIVKDFDEIIDMCMGQMIAFKTAQDLDG